MPASLPSHLRLRCPQMPVELYSISFVTRVSLGDIAYPLTSLWTDGVHCSQLPDPISHVFQQPRLPEQTAGPVPLWSAALCCLKPSSSQRPHSWASSHGCSHL